MNTGYGMLMFADEMVVKDFKYLGKNQFHEKIERILSSRDIERLQMKRWEFLSASPQADINWNDFTYESVLSVTKTVILWVFLLLISVVLITPVLVLEYLTLIVNKI